MGMLGNFVGHLFEDGKRQGDPARIMEFLLHGLAGIAKIDPAHRARAALAVANPVIERNLCTYRELFVILIFE
jgi:hypothetical protein